jgi:hypothetical protein
MGVSTRKLATGFGLAAIAAFVIFVVHSCVAADRAATAFAAALRAGRLDEASALATPELRPYVLDLAPGAAGTTAATDRGSTLRRMRASTRLEEIGGYSGNFTALCGAVALDGDTDHAGVTNTSAWWILR